mgnify:CR=1 FL=1
MCIVLNGEVSSQRTSDVDVVNDGVDHKVLLNTDVLGDGYGSY